MDRSALRSLRGVLDKHSDSARRLWATGVWRPHALSNASGKKYADALYAHNRNGGCLISAFDCLRLSPVSDESLGIDFLPLAVDDEKRVHRYESLLASWAGDAN
jgi:hypothetical protein